LADEHHLRGLREALNDVGGNERVDGDEIGRRDQLRGADCEQAGVAGAGADEKDFPGEVGGWPLAVGRFRSHAFSPSYTAWITSSAFAPLFSTRTALPSGRS